MTRKREESISYVTELILLFFVFSVAGWLWEVGLHLVQDGVFVKRGVLSGPLASHLWYGRCPDYACAAPFF